MTDPNGNMRVKLYRLSLAGNWCDEGTGHVKCGVTEQDGFSLTVFGEADGAPLLKSKISVDLIYQRQGDTIISWTDPDSQVDMALSFQESAGCTEIWNVICSVQGRVEISPLGEETELAGVQEEGATDNTMQLPEPTLDNIQSILDLVTDVSAFKRDRISAAIIKQDYLGKLADLFHICEDLESTEALHMLFKTFKGIVLLNDSSLFELLVSDQYLYDVVGALEYDPDVAKDSTHHRDFLRKNVVFKEVVPIKDKSVVSKIHQNFRLSYLKDAILPRSLDDATFATLNSLIFFNNVEILTHLHADEQFLAELFRRLKSGDATEYTRDLVLFLQEMCGLAKNLQALSRGSFYRSLCQYGLYDIFEKIFNDSDASIRLAGTDIISSSVNHDPSSLRNFLLLQRPRYALFNLFVQGLHGEPDTGIKAQLTDILRTLIDPETMDATPEKDTFLNLFYDEFIEKLVAPLAVQDVDFNTEDPSLAEGRNAARNHLCDLLSFCVQHHGYRIKYFILRNNIVHKVLKLLKHREKYLVLVAIRFFRVCVGIKDEFYNRYIIKNALFNGIFDVFVANGNRYNLLNSAIIELFDFIRKENIKSLVQHLVENFKPTMESVDYVETFKLLIVKYDQNRDFLENSTKNSSRSSGNTATSMSTASRGPPYGPPRPAADDDDAYFNESDDEDDRSLIGNSPSTNTTTLTPSSSSPLIARASSSSPLPTSSSSLPTSPTPISPSPSSLAPPPSAGETQTSVVAPPSHPQTGLMPLVDYEDEEGEESENKENKGPPISISSSSHSGDGPISIIPPVLVTDPIPNGISSPRNDAEMEERAENRIGTPRGRQSPNNTSKRREEGNSSMLDSSNSNLAIAVGKRRRLEDDETVVGKNRERLVNS
mmetsp:Transcript_8812/g.14470  ORF Transcript_8812/g.14470 Transcript_8812/m.14470 type:complete len:883 (+) Transcript_8812:92-2740(+)